MAPKPELVRLAAVSTGCEGRPTATLDRAGTMPGRGAYLCRAEPDGEPRGQCMKLAARRGALQRAFRRVVNVPSEFVESEG